MGCFNGPYNSGSTPQSGGYYFGTNLYPMPGFVFVASPAPLSTSNSYGLVTGNPGQSCADIYSNNANTRMTSGTYYITRSSQTFPVYCDMLIGGGGWTMVAMLASSTTDSTWGYDSAMWTNTATINPTVADITTAVNMKNLAFSSLPLSSIRFVFANGPATSNPGFVVAATGASASAVFAGGAVSTSFARSDFLSMVNAVYGGPSQTSYASSPNCNTIAVNMANPTANCRFGIAMNNEADCNTCDAW